MTKHLKPLLIWIALFTAFVLLWNLFSADESLPVEGWPAVEEDLAAGEVLRLTFDPEELRFVVDTAAGSYQVYGYPGPVLMQSVSEQGLAIQTESEGGEWMSNVFVVLLGVLLLLGLFLFFLRRMQGGATNDMLGLRKVKARSLPESVRVTFGAVGGCEEAKAHLRDVVDFLADPAPWASAGARIPRGILLEGPPGCGKTLLARAVAGEVNASFFFIAASEFVEMFVGVGAARVRDLFETASKEAPAVVFIDELDAVGRRRGSGVGSAHDEREQTLNQLLVCLDGLEAAAPLVVLAATNRHDILDPALLRPGRFDRRIAVPRPDAAARREILQIHTRGKPLAVEIDLDDLTEKTEGMTGADLETLVNDAALLAVRRHRQDGGDVVIGSRDLAEALASYRDRHPGFDRLDQLLVESTSQLAEASGSIRARLVLPDERVLEGAVLWADASFVKIRSADGEEEIVPKAQVVSFRALSGTEPIDPDGVRADPWAGRQPGLA